MECKTLEIECNVLTIECKPLKSKRKLQQIECKQQLSRRRKHKNNNIKKTLLILTL